MQNTMESPKGGFSQVLQKHAGRARERILQNLGRADKTKDEVFESYLHNFTRQQIAATKLQKEFKNYILCIRNMQMASKSLMDCLSEIYEQEWVGHEQIPIKAQALDLLWEDYFRKMNDVLNPLNSYMLQFQDMRAKVNKRGRKLVDYDKSRHTVEALRGSAKKKDDFKLTKARDELDSAKQLYEQINNELHEDLPALYDSRIPFLVQNLQTLFDAECRFHGENAVVYQFLNETMHKLARDSGNPVAPSSFVAPVINHTLPPSAVASTHNSPSHTGVVVAGSPLAASPSSPAATNTQSPVNRPSSVAGSPTSFGMTTSAAAGEVRPYEEIDFKERKDISPMNGAAKTPVSPVTPIQAAARGVTNGGGQGTGDITSVYDIPVGATTTDLPPGVLYKVRATYKYTAEDMDELNFESGEIIKVVEYDDPEEQEEGWLMGVKETTGEKGLFPANFTRPI